MDVRNGAFIEDTLLQKLLLVLDTDRKEIHYNNCILNAFFGDGPVIAFWT